MILTKVAYVLTIIAFVCCIIGVAGSVVGMSLLWLVKDAVIQDGKTIADVLLEKGLTVNAAYVSMANSVLVCGVGIFMALYIGKFYKGVVNDGTPFKRETVKNMRKVAIVYLIVSVATCIMCGLCIGIARAIDKTMPKVDINNWFSLGFSIFFLILSLFVEYPVEKGELNNTPAVEAEVVEEPKEEKE